MRELLLSAVLLLSFGCSVEYEMQSKFEYNGIFRCISPVEGAPIYRFDSTAKTSRVVLGLGGNAFKFVDLESGASVALTEDSMNYQCDRIAILHGLEEG